MTPDDKFYAANKLINLLRVAEFVPEKISETLENLFDIRIMNCVMPRPSKVIAKFKSDYKKSPQIATDNYYKLSIASNYIRKDRIDKNIVWKSENEYGTRDLTINLSKPEKDPRDIAKAKSVKATGYPKCLLCRENEEIDTFQLSQRNWFTSSARCN